MSDNPADLRTAAHRQFEAWSRWYDRSALQWLFFAPTRRRLHVALGELPTNACVLDVGCGTGQFAAELLARRPDVCVDGLDLSTNMIAIAQRRCEAFGARANFRVGDSERLPFPSATFDAVVCAHSFHHYPNQAAVVAETARVLKSGGRLVLADADRDNWWGWALFDGFVNWLEGGVQHCSRRQFRELFAAAGFAVDSQTRHGWLMPFVVNVAVRTAKGARRQAA